MRLNILKMCLLSVFATGFAGAEPLKIERTRTRDLSTWKPQIQKYSERHYGESTWELSPTCIVLHYTVTDGFPWNLVRTESFRDERPGLAVHYVVDGDRVWEILPPNVRSRGAYGINHRAINIEMVAKDADDLAARPKTLETCRRLCQELMNVYAIDKSHIYSHQDVASMRKSKVPEVLDLVTGAPYDKIDPGEANMKTILKDL
jgi:N-acetyl-anhydromuramyl-L-alanine amidase AmpD